MEINITVQIDPDSTLSVGQHFLSIPTFFLYEQRMGNGTAKMFVGSAESVTVSFTVREGTWTPLELAWSPGEGGGGGGG